MTNEKNEVDRRAAPSSSADELPPLPDARAIRAGHAFPKVYALGYTADMMQEYTRSAIAADRRARQGEPVGEVIDGYMGSSRAARLYRGHVFKTGEKLYRAAIQAAAPADAPTHPPRVTPEMVESLNAAIRLLEQAKAAREEMQARLGIAVEDAREQQPDDADNLSVMLWLLRRLPRAYGNPPFVEQAINRLAKRTGTDVADSFAERNESCRATGTDRAQAGEAPAGVKEEGKEG